MSKEKKPLVVSVDEAVEEQDEVEQPSAPNEKVKARSRLAMDGFRVGATTRAMPNLNAPAARQDDAEDVKAQAESAELDENELAEGAAVKNLVKNRPAKSGLAKSEPRFSRPKAALLAIGVALVVGLLGGLIIWLTGRKEVTYCNVQYDANGGSEVAALDVVCGSKLVAPEEPTKEGFEFQEWVLEGLAFNFDKETVNEDLILVARWKEAEGTEVVTVRFDSAGGSVIEEQKVAKGKTAAKPLKEPTREGYQFAGWYLEDKVFDFETPVEQDITLTAHWTAIANNQTSTETPKPAKVTALAVANREVTAGQTVELDVTVTPADAKYQLVVANISEAGAAGAATCSLADQTKPRITCKATADKTGEVKFRLRDSLSGISADFVLTVKEAEITLEEIALDTGATLTLEMGRTHDLQVSFLPAGAKAQALTWTSSAADVAEVSENGKITAKAVGSAIITVRATNDVSKSASVTVTVTNVAVTGVEIGNAGVATLNIGEPLELTATVTPADAADKSVSWSSSNEAVATVNAGGVVTAVAAGTATITVKTTDGNKTATIVVTVNPSDSGGSGA